MKYVWILFHKNGEIYKVYDDADAAYLDLINLVVNFETAEYFIQKEEIHHG